MPIAAMIEPPSRRRWRSLIPALLLTGFAAGCAPDRARAPVGVPNAAESRGTRGVCPPFALRDDAGAVIDPVRGINADAPYSPRQTCGAPDCHDYKKITEGFHFTQGRGEAPTPDQAARAQWAETPGNYGGTWCSPAPLYNYLSPKQNTSAVTMDMTSFTFITAGCGNCHPGGGPLEFDREGRRYDRWMADPASGLSPGGDNGFDGDYYQARWSETGVLEADCLLCHFPGYDFKKRGTQIRALNFRSAARPEPAPSPRGNGPPSSMTRPDSTPRAASPCTWCASPGTRPASNATPSRAGRSAGRTTADAPTSTSGPDSGAWTATPPGVRPTTRGSGDGRSISSARGTTPAAMSATIWTARWWIAPTATTPGAGAPPSPPMPGSPASISSASRARPATSRSAP